MQGFCRLSLRWHQNFCRSSRFAGHQRCIEQHNVTRGYRQSTKRKPPRISTNDQHATVPGSAHLFADATDSDLIVREYEQYGKDKNTVQRADPGAEVDIELAEVRAQMERLERELEIMKQGPFGPQSDLMQSLPFKEREELLKLLTDEGVTHDGEDGLMTMAELDKFADEDAAADRSTTNGRLGVTLKIPRKDQAYIRNFNNALRDAEDGEGDTRKSLVLWTWYLRCQQNVRNFSTITPDDVWETLWRTQAALEFRPRHIVMLAKDMQAAGEPLDESKWIEFIEALQASGDMTTAIEVWQAQKELLTQRAETRHAYQVLGVKLFAALGKPLKAQEMALNAIHNDQAPPHILIPVIVAWANSRGPDALVKAWANYIRLRDFLGTEIEPGVFEEISNAFLQAECADMAVNVFKDMLLTNEQSSFDSQAVYHKATKHIREVMHEATTEEQINQIGLSAMLILPHSFHNRFFFTSWIKKLIGENRIDAAAMVIELMYERNVTPDAKPLNGIIGAWLREGSAKSQQKALKMAWAMVDAKVDLVSRQTSATTSSSLREILPPGDFGHARRAVFLRRHLPPASIETFSILLQHYTRRSDFVEAEKLTQTMTGPCQVKPNSFIMNHWLYADLRSSKISQVWAKYRDLSADISPDLETFAVLWDAGKVKYSRSTTVNTEGFPSSRQLFATMMSWVENIDPRKLTSVKEEFSQDLYEQIVRCFCLSQDLPGALVAILGLRRIFDAVPDDNSLRLICGSAARLLPGVKIGRATRNKPRQRHVLAVVAEIVDTIESQKRQDLIDQGIDIEVVEDLESPEAKELKLRVVTEFICMFLRQTQPATGSYLNDIKIAAETMHVDVADVDLAVRSDQC